jgi:hypothetical protein
VKARINRVITKRRVCLTRAEALSVLTRQVHWWDRCRPDHSDDLDHFAGQMALTSCKPLVRVRYLREAYVGATPEPVRVTFDTHLAYQPTSAPDVRRDAGEWTPIDIGGVILELKFTGTAPAWVEHLVCAFHLQQVSCCKFAQSVGQMIRSGGWHAAGGAAFRIPEPGRQAAV